jgi:signal transduction histidine kinase/CheY-like chemotaxis protein
MRRRWLSLNIKFPGLMTGISLLVGVIFMWSARGEFAGILREASGTRLASSGSMLANAVQSGVVAARSEVQQLAALPDVRDVLTGTGDSARVAQAIRTGLAVRADSTFVRVLVVDTAARVRHELRLGDHELSPGWALEALRRGELSPVNPTFSPLLNANGRAQAEYVAPVHGKPGGESLLGYVIITRAIRGQGAPQIRQLIGNGTLLFGQIDAGIWTDLDSVVDGPPPIARADSILTFAESPRGPGVGIATSIRGTPWVIWLQVPDSSVLAPLNGFQRRMTPILLVVVVVGAALAWSISRRITGRITALTARVDEMAADVQGDAAAATSSRLLAHDGRDEVDRLESAFAMMAERTQHQQQLEAELQQAQKLEAVGRLAGGIAHDFNNVLTVVSNFAEIIQQDVAPDSATSRDLDQIRQATNRASRLTRQLLAFSRRQILQPQPLDVNERVQSVAGLLERLLPAHVNIALELGDGLSAVMADPVQIEQVLLNLAVNASDAMPSGGRLTIRTLMADLDDLPAQGVTTPASGTEITSRRHVCLVVKDSGVGMDRETLQRVFEPFFTTKPIGKGTGLGLASVHGTVAQLGGRVWVYSEPGKGTTFKVFLPQADEAVSAADTVAVSQTVPRGSGTVLLVEDEPGTREVTRRLLERSGYSVIELHTANEALDRLASDRQQVCAVLTDVMMPGMNGMAFARHVWARWPDLPVVLMSGYSDTDVLDEADARHVHFLEKPFTSATLLKALSDAQAGVAPLRP